MTPDTANARPVRASALHAVVAVLLALMVSAAGPLGGASKESSDTDVRLVQCSAEHAAAIRVGVLPDFSGGSAVERCAHTPAPTQLIRSQERARWTSALPPPARA
jgi:hypothetical protein